VSNPPIVLLGEARGAEEDRIKSSFCGPSGVELLRQLDEAKIIELTREDKTYISKYYSEGKPTYVDQVWKLHTDEVLRTNVLNLHPPGNKLEGLCTDKANGIWGMPAIDKGKYLSASFEPELDRLTDELINWNPNLIICLGNTALWALTGQRGVAKIRGTTLESTHCATGFKLLATYHPAAVLRQWELRPTTIMDLIKAKRESQYAEIKRPNCEIWIEPSLDDIRRFIDNYVRGCDLLSVDIETAGDRVTCIGFAPRPDLAIVIPFDDSRAKGGCYWPSKQAERECWDIIRTTLESPSIPKLFQNGVYDIGFLMRSYGILVKGAKEDTMLISHARQPESLKGLGYLGSIFTDHGSWKSMRKEVDTNKRDA
jgi:uracil-DNA glycosylase